MKDSRAYFILNKILNGFTTNSLCSCNHKDGQAIIRTKSDDNVALFTCILDGIDSDDYQNLGIKKIEVSPEYISGDKQNEAYKIRGIPDFDCEQVWEVDNSNFCLCIDIANEMSHNAIHQNAFISLDHISQMITFLASYQCSGLKQDYLVDLHAINLKGDMVTGPRSFNGLVIDVSILKDLLLDYIHQVSTISMATQTYTGNPYPLRIKFDLLDIIHCEYLQAPILIRE